MYDDDNDDATENLEYITNLNKFMTITTDISSDSFCHFKSHMDHHIYLLWANDQNTIEVLDLSMNRIKMRIKAHTDKINSLHYYYDHNEKRDILVTSSDDKSIKLWGFPKFEKILEIKNDSITYLQANIFTEKIGSSSKWFIIAEMSDNVIVLFDSEGNFIRKFTNGRLPKLWHDHHTNSCFLVSSHKGVVCFTDLTTGKEQKKFKCLGNTPRTAILNNVLITADDEGWLRTYCIEKGELINEYKLSQYVTHITIWDIEYFFVFLSHGSFLCFEAKTLSIVKSFSAVCESVTYAEGMIHPILGPSLAITGQTKEGRSLILFYDEPHQT
jgi:WD40 repeat protein